MIEERQIGDHTIMVEVEPCPVCNQPMDNIVFFGWVCVECDKKEKDVDTI